jgi:hypothetical protein
MAWGTADRWAIPGPFVARVSEGGLSDVTAQGSSYVPRTEPKLRPRAWRAPKTEGGFFALTGLAAGDVSIGAEAIVTARITPWRSYDLWAGLIGEDVGVSARARWSSSVTSRIRDFRIGLAPVLEDSDIYRDWSYPSPIGLLVPEIGIGRREQTTAPYFGWSLPVTRRFVSPLVRRHPFDAADVLGIRIAAEALLSFRQAAVEKTFWLSTGITVW